MNKNDCEVRLIKAGISPQQIKKARAEFPQRQPDLNLREFIAVSSSTQVEISLSKVKYLNSRANINMSWFDNFTKNKNYRQGPGGSFCELLSNLEKNGVANFINSFQKDQTEPISAIYYEDFDTFIIEEGKHRVTFAKVIGMKKIKAEVTTLKSNPSEINKYIDYEKKKKELKKTLQNLNLEFDCQRRQHGFYKGEQISIQYRQKNIVKLDILDSYYLDYYGKNELNFQVVYEIAKFIKKINSIPCFRNFIAKLKANNKNLHPLSKLILNRLIKQGYFKNTLADN